MSDAWNVAMEIPVYRRFKKGMKLTRVCSRSTNHRLNTRHIIANASIYSDIFEILNKSKLQAEAVHVGWQLPEMRVIFINLANNNSCLKQNLVRRRTKKLKNLDTYENTRNKIKTETEKF